MTKYGELIIKELGLEDKSHMVKTIAKLMFSITLKECSYANTEVNQDFPKLVAKLESAGFHGNGSYALNTGVTHKVIFGNETDSFEFKIADLTEQWSNDLHDILSAEIGVEDIWGKMHTLWLQLVTEDVDKVVSDVVVARDELERIAREYRDKCKELNQF